jgi:CrcB protein
VIALMVGLGALVGAPARYLTDRAFQSRRRARLPWGTLTVNLVACLVLGLVVGVQSHLSDATGALIGTGFCGALSTYSTFSFETMRLVEQGERVLAVANVGLNLAAGLGAGALGWWLSAAIS